MTTKSGRPVVAEKTITKTIIPLLLHGGGTPAERGRAAAGLIQNRVCDAYGIHYADRVGL